MPLKRVSSVPKSLIDDVVGELREKTRMNAGRKQIKLEKPSSAQGLKRSETEQQIKTIDALIAPVGSKLENSNSQNSL